MDPRQQRGLEIAALLKIKRKGGVWLCPSSTGSGEKYTVCLDAAVQHCTCPDHETRAVKCKHIWACEFVQQREKDADGNETVTTNVTITERIQRPTYTQDWPAYNAAQCNEKAKFQQLLADLCKNIVNPPQGKGRPRLPLADCVFAAIFKVYSGFSGRRFTTDLHGAKERGFIDEEPHYNSVFRCLESEDVTAVLDAIVRESSMPLRAVETDFAVDSTGFGTTRYARWYYEKYGAEKKETHWIKAHACVGVKTHVITSVTVLDKDSADSPQFKGLVQDTAKRFTIGEISADKAYSSVEAHNTVSECGGTPYIAFKSVATGAAGGLFQKCFHYFSFKREEFLQHYHKRSNVESAFSMMKRKHGDSLRSKTDTALKNELLAKVVCHNICCVIMAMYELGLEPVFWGEELQENRPAIHSLNAIG